MPRHPFLVELDRRFLEGPTPDEAGWYAAVRRTLEEAYLASDNPYEQSGTSSDAARWERLRRPICAAVDRDGAFLDIGCANGLLMETLARWAGQDGHRVEPYGLDYSEPLAALARRRLPHWADRVWVGNAADWDPPRRFDFVRVELDYVPPRRQAELVDRLLDRFLLPGGRLIVCAYGNRSVPGLDPIAGWLAGWGHAVAGQVDAADADGTPATRVAWVDRP